jgi:hypothetical protein
LKDLYELLSRNIVNATIVARRKVHQWIKELTHGPLKRTTPKNRVLFQTYHPKNASKMVIITRSRARQTTPETPTSRYKADTIKKSRFYNKFDELKDSRSLTSIAEDSGTTRFTAARWLKEREEYGRAAYRSSRKKSKKLGRNTKLSKQRVRDLCDPQKNPVRKQRYEAQIAFHSLRVHPRTLQSLLKKFTNKGQRYKAAYVKKEISKKNKKKRENYGLTHEKEPIHGF